LDEAFIAASLLPHSIDSAFGRLEYGQYFPRIYLSLIALVRLVFGYELWSLRLLPLLSFVAGTAIWVRLLVLRTKQSVLLGVLGAGLLLGSIDWLNQAVQLKQYTLDVCLGLLPFLLSDSFWTRRLVTGKRRFSLVLLAIPCVLSYVYPIALAGRLIGWYVVRGRRHGWRLDVPALVILGISMGAGFLTIYITDYRPNFRDLSAYQSFWSNCILADQLSRGPVATLDLLSKFLWGWHGRQPLVTIWLVPLQLLGCYSIFRKWRKKDFETEEEWGSRSVGSLAVLSGTILASAVAGYPICGGRVVLFSQVHTQIVAIEGAIFLLGQRERLAPWKPAMRLAVYALFCACAIILILHSGRGYVRYLRAEAPENLKPIIGLITPEIADTVWVHPCSAAQVKTLPDPLPVPHVVLGVRDNRPPPGQRLWVLWSHLGSESCRARLEQLRRDARAWQLLRNDPDRGLALAEF
jgi:hypothetical protein